MYFDLIGWEPQGSRQFAGGSLPGIFISGVDQNDVFSIAETMLKVYGSDSRGLHLEFLSKPHYRIYLANVAAVLSQYKYQRTQLLKKGQLKSQLPGSHEARTVSRDCVS